MLFLCISGGGRHVHKSAGSNPVSGRVKVFNMQNKSVCVACVNLNLLKISFFMQDLCNPIHFLIISIKKNLIIYLDYT